MERKGDKKELKFPEIKTLRRFGSGKAKL